MFTKERTSAIKTDNHSRVRKTVEIGPYDPASGCLGKATLALAIMMQVAAWVPRTALL